MGIYLINPQKMLIGKLTKRAYKPFHPNDRVIIEKNIYNLLKIKLAYSGYYNDEGKLLADTIAYDRDGYIYLIGFKKNKKDKYIERYKKQLCNLKEDRYRFESLMSGIIKKEVSLLKIRMILIGYMFDENEIKSIKEEMDIPCNFYTWCMADNNLLIFNKITKRGV
ncbi:MAG: hypothetical protein ACOCRX_00890 [Candidatus Woesearchaeota archaeon]